MISEFIILHPSGGYGNLIGTGEAAKQLLRVDLLSGKRNRKKKADMSDKINVMTDPSGKWQGIY